eukprot:9133194-Alexandrium_andersonii.AAC.1
MHRRRLQGNAMFAAAPPLEAARFLLSGLATCSRVGEHRRRPGARRALFVAREAHLHAFVGEGVYVALPPK